MRRWTEFVLSHRKWVVVGWILIAVAGASVAGNVSQRMTFDYSLPGEAGTETAKQLDDLFGNGGYSAPYLISITYPSSASEKHDEEAARAFRSASKAAPHLRVVSKANTGDSAFDSKDGRTSFAMVFYPFNSSPTAKPPKDKILTALESAKPEGTRAGLTGEDVLAQGSSEVGPGVLAETLLGAIGALAVLAFVFASFLAILPLFVAAASILATFLLLLPLTYAGDFSALVMFLVALVGLGVAIDYSLLVVTRWREERAHGRDNHDAVSVAMQTAGRSVIFSGVTVGIGLLSLLILPVPFMRSVGVGGALIPLVSVAATLSLTPAILGGIGPRLDWPRVRHEGVVSRAWSAWARKIIAVRWVAAGGSLAILLGLVVAFAGINIGQSSSASLAKNGPAYDTMQTLEQGGVATGYMTPIEVLVSSEHSSEAAGAFREVKGVARVLVPEDDASERAGMNVIEVVPARETVSSSSVEVVRRVQDRAALLPGVEGITGVGAAQLDFLHAVYGNFPLMLTTISLLTFILLVRAFRSLLLPLKAVLLNLLSLGATYGLVVLFWQHGFGSEAVFGIQETGAITFWIPLIVFAFLYGLSMDYEVFILARMREEFDATGSTDLAIITGMARTGRLVTCAALILFLAFAALGSSPGTDLKVMASALGFGILLDATIVRSLLLPSLVSLFGRWNWYLPEFVARILRVEPSPPLRDATDDLSIQKSGAPTRA